MPTIFIKDKTHRDITVFTDQRNTFFDALPWEAGKDMPFDENMVPVTEDLLPVARIEGVTWGVLSPLAADNLVVGQEFSGHARRALRRGAAGQRVTLRELGQRRLQRLRRQPRGAVHAVRPGDPRSTRAAPDGASGAPPAGRSRSAQVVSRGRAGRVLRRACVRHPRRVVRYAKERGMKPVIAGGAEAWVVAKELAAADVPVILNPLENLPADFDRLGARFDNARILNEAGVRIAFSFPDSFQVRKNRQLAGNAVAHGLPWDAALAAITSSPAGIFGLGGQRGRIERARSPTSCSGAAALEVTSVAEQVWIDGHAVPVCARARRPARSLRPARQDRQGLVANPHRRAVQGRSPRLEFSRNVAP